MKKNQLLASDPRVQAARERIDATKVLRTSLTPRARLAMAKQLVQLSQARQRRSKP